MKRIHRGVKFFRFDAGQDEKKSMPLSIYCNGGKMTEVNPENVGQSSKIQGEYASEYQQGVTLFEKALQQSRVSKNPFQKDQFQEVMETAMEVLNQTASALKNAELQKQNEQINRDFQSYKRHPGKSEADKLANDLNQAKLF